MKIIHAACSGLSIRACGRSTTFARARAAGAPVCSTERLSRVWRRAASSE